MNSPSPYSLQGMRALHQKNTRKSTCPNLLVQTSGPSPRVLNLSSYHHTTPACATCLPADYVKWEQLPAGVSTMTMDQPPASRHLAYSRYMGHALPWRGKAEDGMVLQGGSFGKMLRSNLCNSKENKLKS
ncbi:unnamed protein product, partial [Durusdinium trenchii]